MSRGGERLKERMIRSRISDGATSEQAHSDAAKMARETEKRAKEQKRKRG